MKKNVVFFFDVAPDQRDIGICKVGKLGTFSRIQRFFEGGYQRALLIVLKQHLAERRVLLAR